MDKKINIYIATHKKTQMPEEKIYIPLHVGAEGKEDLGYLKDNTGENISIKNPNYCELTGTYWIMKNDNSDIVGLTHYRRYFFKYPFSNNIKNIIKEEDILKIMKKYDIITPKKLALTSSINKNYAKLHHKEDLEECGKIINEKFPDYKETFNNVLNNWNMYSCNMFISRKETFDEYYKWLFDILFELEKRIDISKYDDYNKRIYGFLSERLFNVWIEKNKEYLKIKELVVYNTDKKLLPQIKEKILTDLIKIKNKIMYG